MKSRLGELLCTEGQLSQDQLSIALQEQQRTQQTLGQQLLALGFITEAQLTTILARQLGYRPAGPLHTRSIDASLLEQIPAAFARQHHLLPLAYDPASHCLSIATVSHHNLPALDQLKQRFTPGLHIEVEIAPASEVDRAIDQHYGQELEIDSLLAQQADNKQGFAQATELIDAILSHAVKSGASDIHFAPENGYLRLRYRVDGTLRLIRVLHHRYWPAMAVRLKVLGGLNIAETRLAQDGRFQQVIGGRAIDFRVACLPTLHGENLVLRILDRNKGIVALEDLGLGEQAWKTLQRVLTRPAGLFLVTGPTGSGKTTTLYSILNHLNQEDVHIITLEDPVEYPLTRLRQVCLGETAKLGFAEGIRAILRQDPDILLIGEIRDSETADMALRAALTGHQVFATLHCHSALGALARLADLGQPADKLSGNLSGIMAQRLVRRLCPHCKFRRQPSAHEATALAIDINANWVHEATGCPRCGETGFTGRLAISEILYVDHDIEALITARRPAAELLTCALSKGFQPLAKAARQAILAGETCLSEVQRHIDMSEH